MEEDDGVAVVLKEIEAWMRVALFQAYASADTITPTITAMAKSVNTVTIVTNTMTRASVSGIRRRMVTLCQANVPMTTMNITPTRAASGICSIKLDATRMKASRNNAEEIPDKRVRPPDFMLIMD